MAKELIGKVVSTKMQKTVVVAVDLRIRHPLYQKTLVRTKKYKAETGDLKIEEGQMVKILACKPVSKDKHFKVLEVIKK